MRTLAEINAEIAKVTNELKDVHGREAEVYTRIVGYYRSVRNWNKGKREEFGIRKLFSLDACSEARDRNTLITKENCHTDEFNFAKERVARVDLYTRETCPNCSPIVEYFAKQSFKANEHNVDSQAGFELARKNNVRSAPTVICYDDNGVELVRVHSVADLEKIF